MGGEWVVSLGEKVVGGWLERWVGGWCVGVWMACGETSGLCSDALRRDEA